MTGMDRASLRDELKASLMDAANAFTDPGDFDRHLDRAAGDLPRRRPLVLTGSLTLKANQAAYTPVPTDLVRPVFSRWANSERVDRPPWAKDHPPPRPRVTLVNEDGTRKLHVTPVPTASELATFGDTLQYDYDARYTIADAAEDTTVRPEDRWLLLLRAQAEAMGELAIKNVDRPVRVGTEGGAQSANGTPAGLRQRLMQEFQAA